MNITSIILDGLRTMLWYICAALLQMLDIIYQIIMEIVVLNLSDFPWIWDWTFGLMVILGFFITARVFVMYIKAVMNEDEVLDPINILSRIVMIAGLLIMLPFILNYLSELTTGMINLLGVLIEGDVTSVRPSNVIASVGFNGDFLNIDYLTIDINTRVNGDYIYYTTAFDFLFMVVATVISAVLYLFIGIQVATRIVSLLFKILMLPWVVSTFVDPKDETFSRWGKLCIGDFLTSFFQMLLIILSLALVASVELSPIANLILFIGALMAIMNTPTGIAQLLGGDVGTGTAFQQLQSMMMLTSGLSMAGGLVAGAAKTSAAAGVYGTGRAFGGKSMLNQVNRVANGSVGGFDAGGSSGSGYVDNSASSSGSEPSGEFNDSGSGSDGASMSYPGAGANPSGSRETGSREAGGMGYVDNSMPSRGTYASSSPAETYAKQGSVADRVASTMKNAEGWKGAVGRVGVMAARKAYQKSANHLSQNRSGKMGQRQSRFVSASHVFHDIANAIRSNDQNRRVQQ